MTNSPVPIENAKQYEVTKAAAAQFVRAIENGRETGPGAGVDPQIHQAMLDGLESQLQDLTEQIADYDQRGLG